MQVRTLPDAPSYDAVAQLEEHCPVTAKAAGSRPVSIAKFEQHDRLIEAAMSGIGFESVGFESPT
jgi:hypothetical protein